MSRISAAVDVATDYAFHLYSVDGVPKTKAIAIGVASVVRAVRANPAQFVTQRQPPAESGVGWSGQVLSLVGSSLSVVGLMKTIFGGG